MSPITQLPGESDASLVARRLQAQLDADDDKTPDSEWRHPVLQAGPAYLLMLGPHTDHGLCWCQPTMEPCISGAMHSHPTHRDKEH